MDWRSAVVIALLLSGTVLVGYGLATGDSGSYGLDVSGPVGDDEIRNDTVVVTYDDLPTRLKEAFRTGLDSGDLVPIADPPDEARQIVEYRGEQYRMDVVSADASQTRMVAFVLAGVALLVLSLVARTVFER